MYSRFSHRTLQEYFALLGPSTKPTRLPCEVSLTFCSYFFHPEWSEVVRLIAAGADPSNRRVVVECILDDPDPIGRFLSAGHSLRCAVCRTARRSPTGVRDSRVEFFTGSTVKWLGVTLEAFDVLESLAGTRHEQLANDTISAILETAKIELDG